MKRIPWWTVATHVLLAFGALSAALHDQNRTLATAGATVRQAVAGDFSTFIFTIEEPPVGFTAPILAAGAVLGNSWVSSVPVRVTVVFNSAASNVLAVASPETFIDIDGHLFTVASAEAIQGYRANEDTEPDITVTVNSAYSSYHFDAETDPASNRVDLLTTMLHEIYHGLLFTGRAMYRIANGDDMGWFDGKLTAYDTFLALGNCTVAGFLGDNVSEANLEVGASFVSNALSLYFTGTNLAVYNPPTFLSGSSIYHLDRTSVGTTMCMSPTIPQGIAQRTICKDVLDFQKAVLSRADKESIGCEAGQYSAIIADVSNQTLVTQDDTVSGEILGMNRSVFFALVGILGGALVLLLVGAIMCVPLRRKGVDHVVVVSAEGEILSDFMSPRGPGAGPSAPLGSGRFFTPGGPGAPAAPAPSAVFRVDANGMPVAGSGRLTSFNFQNNQSRQSSFSTNRIASFNAGAPPPMFGSRTESMNRTSSALGPGMISPFASPPGSPPPVPSPRSPSNVGRPPTLGSQGRKTSAKAVGGPAGPMSPPLRPSGRIQSPPPLGASGGQMKQSGRLLPPPTIDPRQASNVRQMSNVRQASNVRQPSNVRSLSPPAVRPNDPTGQGGTRRSVRGLNVPAGVAGNTELPPGARAPTGPGASGKIIPSVPRGAGPSGYGAGSSSAANRPVVKTESLSPSNRGPQVGSHGGSAVRLPSK